MAKSLVKDSEELRNALIERWTKVFGKRYQKAVADDANEHGRKDIFRSGVNRYVKAPYDYNALNEDQILFLAQRWNIDVSLYVRTRPYNEKRIKKSKPKNDNNAQGADAPGD